MEDCTFIELPYRETGFFSKTVEAYASGDDRLRPFYKHPVSREGVAAAIRARQSYPIDRQLLVATLEEQYKGLPQSAAVTEHIRLLGNENTFTVCTAHQPAIFTGNLFFIYKILHTIRLAASLQEDFPDFQFVPVFYMGSEDADLDELGNIFLGGEKIVWDTPQRGAIGRMHLKGLDKLFDRIAGELSVLPHGEALVQLLKEHYLDAPDIQTATLKLLHHLFGEYGLVVLIPDHPRLKQVMVPVFEEELLAQHSAALVEQTLSALAENFKVQASPRAINLFYQKDDLRERIERVGEEWKVVNTDIVFDRNGLLEELRTHPDRFSPNVILRGLFQEMILPNIAFIGGGGELAYWMELGAVFEHHGVPYPMLVLRNSFLLIEHKWKHRLDKLQLPVTEIFRSEADLLSELVQRESKEQLTLTAEIEGVSAYYDRMKLLAGKLDTTLEGHVAALQTRALQPLEALEKKMLRAEKRKYENERRQLSTIRQALFPNGGLQERVENFMPFYAKWGKQFIRTIYDHSLTLEQVFGIIVEQSASSQNENIPQGEIGVN